MGSVDEKKRLPTGSTITRSNFGVPSALSAGDFIGKQRKTVG